jgi:putative oxidoreductase
MLKQIYSSFPQGRYGLTLLVLRLVFGAAFVLHGFPKIQNAFHWMGDALPPALQALAAVSEFGGGLAMILGLLTPLAALGLISTMSVAIFAHHLPAGDPFVNLTGGSSYELAAIYLAIALLLLAHGPGAYSVDALLFQNRALSNRANASN